MNKLPLFEQLDDYNQEIANKLYGIGWKYVIIVQPGQNGGPVKRWHMFTNLSEYDISRMSVEDMINNHPSFIFIGYEHWGYDNNESYRYEIFDKVRFYRELKIVEEWDIHQLIARYVKIINAGNHFPKNRLSEITP
jgi:hypothetical protein